MDSKKVRKDETEEGVSDTENKIMENNDTDKKRERKPTMKVGQWR